MPKKSKFKYSLEGMPLYPHIKLTRERFPRLLATRIIANDDAEYFGAFLNRTNARMLIDFLNRTFKLRSCDMPIDGSFNYPCTMYYKKRCLAPCVTNLIVESSYGEMVGLVRLFLANERGLLAELLKIRIRISSDALDFETAAKWRDILAAVEEYWADVRHAVWLDGTSDTFFVRDSKVSLDIFLISQKGRRVLGERVFSFERKIQTDAEYLQALAEVIEQFYRFHAPKEIRVDRDFPERQNLQKMLSTKFGRSIPIRILNEKNRKISSELAIYRSSAELDVKRSKFLTEPKDLVRQLKEIFSLPKIPKRITAIDVSHISGTNQVAAKIVWENGRTVSNDAQYLLSESSSELETLSEFVSKIFSDIKETRAELVLIDGGRAQLNAALKHLNSKHISVISAVKPPAEHSEISHFLSATERIEFDPESAVHRLLQRLRDEAHQFANAVHRDTRDFENFYEAANLLPSLTETERQMLLLNFKSTAAILKATRQELEKVVGKEKTGIAMKDIENYKAGNAKKIKPLVVPIRFHDENGAADDLRMIATRQKRRDHIKANPS